MRTLKYVRIDERLIHGQVLMKWLKERNLNRIVIVDDMLQENPIIQSVMRRSVPKECAMEVYSCSEAGEELRGQEMKAEALMLVRDLPVLRYLEEEGIRFEEINIARMPYSTGRDKICDQIYMDKGEQDMIGNYLRKGSEVYVQMVPDSEKRWLKDLLD